MPNQTVIKQWVDALRSGEYEQTIGKLGRADNYTDHHGFKYRSGHCCLGVLCELAVKAGVADRHAPVDMALSGIAYDGELNTLPPRVQNWAGLDSNNPTVGHLIVYADEDGKTEQATDMLSTLNDEFNKSFAEIADAIEATYLAKPDAGQPA